MTTYYVATSGSNSGNGSASSPWKTISKAMQASLKPGDEVVVRAGTYNESVRISKDGTANNYITVRAEKPGTVKIDATGEYGVHIQANYVKLDGFNITGASAAGVTANLVHHVEITDNNVYNNGRHGISASRSDFVTIEGNVTHGNASKGFYSGISIFHPENVSHDNSSKGFRIIVRGNISYDNVTKSGPHSDGNGIIMDDFRSTKAPARAAYLFASLVENNVVYQNGGKGIQVAWSDYVTVRNNTAWSNNVDKLKTGTWHGELSNMNSSHNTWVNNIAVANQKLTGYNTAIDNTSFANYTNSDVIWKNNLTYNGSSGDASVRTTGSNKGLSTSDGNLLGINPKFISAPGNFELQSGSPAIDAGTKAYGYNSKGIDSGARVGAPDLGAYEANGKSKSSSTTVVEETATESSTSDTSPASGLNGTAKADVLTGTAKADSIYGNGGNDKLSGLAGKDALYGGAGADTLDGGKGADVLQGGNGKDMLIGGAGADRFVFKSVAEAGKGNAGDDIRDFSRAQGDKIDLSGIDAMTNKAGDQAFSFIGSKGFSGDAGELRYAKGHLYGDVNGDKIADFDIHLVNSHALNGTDFIL